MKSIYNYAKYYVHKKGFSVIPIKPKSKKPALPSWKEYQERKPNDKELKKWFNSGNSLNIGIVTGKISNIIVVDLDSEEAVKYAEENLPKTPTVKTRKGQHLYFQYHKRNRCERGWRASCSPSLKT
jgi:hypothetical protein